MKSNHLIMTSQTMVVKNSCYGVHFLMLNSCSKSVSNHSSSSDEEIVQVVEKFQSLGGEAARSNSSDTEICKVEE